MKTVVIDNEKYIIPESWDEITLKTQIRVNNYMSEFEGERLQKIGMLAGYINIPFDKLKKMKISKAETLTKYLNFLNKPLPTDAINKFDFNGETYYVGQNLIDAEFQDYVSIQNVLQMYSGNTLQALPTIIAVMAKRQKKDGTFESLDDYNVEERAKMFEELPITTAHRMSVFFYHSIGVSQMLSHFYSNPKELVLMKIEELENTMKKQVGVGWLIRLRTGILRWYLRYIKKRLDKYFTL